MEEARTRVAFYGSTRTYHGVFEAHGWTDIGPRLHEMSLKGQWEASQSLGLSRYAGFRNVILPQAMRLMLPPLTGQSVSLIKDSSIVSVIAIFDLTSEGRNVISDTFMSFEIWFTVAALYLVLTVSLSALAGWVERAMHRPAMRDGLRR